VKILKTSMKNIKLHKDWKIVELKEVVSILGDGLHGTPKYSIESEYFFINGNNLVNGKIKIKENTKKVSFEEYEKYKKPLNSSSLLVSINGTLGNQAFYNNEKVILGKSACYFNVLDSLDKKYISLVLSGQEFLNYAHKNATGSTIPNVSLKSMREFKFPLPPTETQQAIVYKIEELFSELDKGIEDLKTAQQQLKTYRQSVLKWAFEGKLTNENVKDGELPKGWEMVQIKDVASTYGGYAFKSGEFKSQGKYQVLRMGNVRPGIVRYDESPVFLEVVEQSVLNRALLNIDDVIITQTGTRKKRDYGFTTLISKTNLLLNQRIAAIRFNDSYSPKFFLYYSWTDLFKDQFFANETGNVGQGNVGMKAVTETLIPKPVIEEQQLIVQEIESRLSVADKMEESIAQSLQQAEALRQSILKKAFSGELV
jgi:type I restriction enzyme, S subunit